MFIRKSVLDLVIADARKDGWSRGLKQGFNDGNAFMRALIEDSVHDRDARIESLIEERNELRHTVIGLDDELLSAYAAKAEMKLRANQAFSDQVETGVVNPSPTEAYCVMWVQKVGESYREVPVSADMSIAEAIAQCNVSNMQRASFTEHYEIRVF